MVLFGADVAQLRDTAKQFDAGADRLQVAVKSLNSLVSGAAAWRGPDAERFRSDWSQVSVPTVSAAQRLLHDAALSLRRHADEQDRASGTGSAGAGSVDHAATASQPVSAGASGLWKELQSISKEPGSAGYRIQHLDGNPPRYIVYIGGTDSADGQWKGANVPAAMGIPDQKQLDALRRIIPGNAEVMLVGYSQGGMDAQNIAAQKDNGFKVTQIVTYGSPVRPDLDIPAVHLQANGDGVPTSASIDPFGPYLTNSTGSNPDAKIYHGQPNVGGMSIQIHGGAYGYLADKWDQADFAAAKRISKFQGTILSTQDLNVDGNVM